VAGRALGEQEGRRGRQVGGRHQELLHGVKRGELLETQQQQQHVNNTGQVHMCMNIHVIEVLVLQCIFRFSATLLQEEILSFLFHSKHL